MIFSAHVFSGAQTWLSDLARDIRFGWRVIAKAPVVSSVIVLSLAVGIGANSAVFSWIQTVAFNPLPGVRDNPWLAIIEQRNDGNIIRVVFPELTEERRRDYIKVAKGKAEDSKVSIRSVRRKAKDAIDKLVKDGEVGEDEGRRAEKELDDTTAKYVAQVDELLKHKEAELLEV